MHNGRDRVINPADELWQLLESNSVAAQVIKAQFNKQVAEFSKGVHLAVTRMAANRLSIARLNRALGQTSREARHG